MDVTIEMNLDLGVIQREGYNVFDALSDIGGIQSLIAAVFSSFIGMWNYKHFDNYMASKLFKIQQSSRTNAQKKENKLRADREPKFIEPTRFCNIMHYLMDLIPKRFQFCRKTRKQRGIDGALHLM